MGRAYSMDLRDRVVGSIESGRMSCRGAASHFGVAASSAIKWMQRYELLPVWWTGSLACGGDLLELNWAEIADGRVSSPRIVETFDIVEHIGPGLVSGVIDLPGGALGFQR